MSSTKLHLLLAKDGRDFHQSLDIIIRVEEGEAAGDDAQNNDAHRPNVNGCHQADRISMA